LDKGNKENAMTLLELIQNQIQQLPPEKQAEVLDFATFLQERAQKLLPASSDTERTERLRRAFAALAEMKTFANITDPIEWQRQIRKDRPLPGREA
jgi:hypothetical protein